MGGENQTWEEYRNTENTGEQELESDDRIQEGFSYKNGNIGCYTEDVWVKAETIFRQFVLFY